MSKKLDDILFINASQHFEKNKRINKLLPEHINKIIDTYQNRIEESRYSRRVVMDEIKKNNYNLNISRYISTAEPEKQIDLQVVNDELINLKQNITQAEKKHNSFWVLTS